MTKNTKAWLGGLLILLMVILVLCCLYLESRADSIEPLPTNAEQVVLNNTKQVTLNVPTMTCAMCPRHVRKALEKVDGVINATVDYDSKTAQIVYDPSKATTDQLIDATTNVGYPSTMQSTKHDQ